MHLKSLNIVYNKELIISDIDDCLIFSREAILNQRIKPKLFYFNNDVFEKHKNLVFENVQLTPWGKELNEILKNKSAHVILITSCKNRLDILCGLFHIEKTNIYENLNYNSKINFLNKIDKSAIYVDDKSTVINSINNSKIQGVVYSPCKLT